MKKGLVSVIVPVFNGEMFLKFAIQSILNQTYKDIEIIVKNIELLLYENFTAFIRT